MSSDIADCGPCRRGPMVSVEGISGVGKSYLTRRLADDLAGRNTEPLVLEEFSARQQLGRRDLGRDLLQVLVSSSGGDRFLRGGHPAAETLSLLAIKMFDYETSRSHLARAGRSLRDEACTRLPSISRLSKVRMTKKRSRRLAGSWGLPPSGGLYPI